MLFWLIPLVLLALLSPLFWLLPKAGQSQRMQLRLSARQMGLSMQLAPASWPHWMTDAPCPCPLYQRPRKTASGLCGVYWQVSPSNWQNQWREPCVDNNWLSLLQPLPEDVYKIEADSQQVSIYWGERSGLAGLEKIAGALKTLTAASDASPTAV